MPRKRTGFARVTASREWNLARSNELNYDGLMAAKARIELLEALIEAAADKAQEMGLAYPEFDALMDEVNSRPEPVPIAKTSRLPTDPFRPPNDEAA